MNTQVEEKVRKVRKVLANIRPSKAMGRASVLRRHQMAVESVTGSTAKMKGAETRSATSSMCAASVSENTLNTTVPVEEPHWIQLHLD